MKPFEAQIQLDLPGLPDRYGLLMPGGLYLMFCEQPQWLQGLLQRLLVAADTAVLSQADEPVPLSAEGRSLWRQGRFVWLDWMREPVGSPAFLRAMERKGLGHKQLIVLQVADAGLMTDAEAVQRLLQLRQWLHRHRIAMLVVQRRDWQDRVDAGLEISTLFSGMVRLDEEDGPLFWRVLHWSSPGGLLAGDRFVAKVAGDGQLELVDDSPMDTLSETLLPERFLVAHSAVNDFHAVPEQWQVMADNRAVVDAAATAGALNFILAVERQDTFTNVASQIQALRLRLGRRIRIALRERGTTVRHAQMVLLRRVGCNLLIPDLLPASRIATLLEPLHHVTETPFFSGDIQPLLLALQPFQQRGYLPLDRFVQQLQAMLDAIDGPLEAVLVCLELLPGVEPQQALTALEMHRSGDVASADPDHVWIYLHGCQPGQVTRALEHILKLPLDLLFSGQLQLTEKVDMEQHLRQLNRRVERGDWHDYRPWLLGQRQQAEPEAVDSTGAEVMFRPRKPEKAVPAPLHKRGVS